MVAAGSGSGSEARRPLRAEWAPSQAWCTARLAQVLRGEQMVGGYVDGRDAALVARGKPEGGGRVDRQGGLQVTRPLEVALGTCWCMAWGYAVIECSDGVAAKSSQHSRVIGGRGEITTTGQMCALASGFE